MKKSIGVSNEAEIGHILGLDFGQAKIGLAIADSETRMAFAFGVLPNDSNFFEKIRQTIREKNVETIIVGIPEHRLGNDEAREFGERMEKETGIKVEFQNEMFTTKMAAENIKERGGRDIAEKDDQEAARIILQSWLDRQG